MCLAISVAFSVYFSSLFPLYTFHWYICHWWCPRLKILEQRRVFKKLLDFLESPKPTLDSKKSSIHKIKFSSLTKGAILKSKANQRLGWFKEEIRTKTIIFFGKALSLFIKELGIDKSRQRISPWKWLYIQVKMTFAFIQKEKGGYREKRLLNC